MITDPPLIVGTNELSELAVAGLPREAEDAIAEVVERHRDEFRDALRPLGIDFDTVLAPDWYRAVSISEARAVIEAREARIRAEQEATS